MSTTPASPYPVGYEADYTEHRSRLTTFFRNLMAIPAMLVGAIYGFALMFTWFGAAVALLFTARYPEGLYRFNSKMLRFGARINSYVNLLTDAFPPMDLDEHPEYPVRVSIAPAKERYSRAKVFFRGFIGIPVMFMMWIYGIGMYFVVLGSWFRIVFTGKQSAGSHGTLTRWMRYTVRGNAYFMYLTEESPPSAATDALGSPATPAPTA